MTDTIGVVLPQRGGGVVLEQLPLDIATVLISCADEAARALLIVWWRYQARHGKPISNRELLSRLPNRHRGDHGASGVIPPLVEALRRAGLNVAEVPAKRRDAAPRYLILEGVSDGDR